MSAKVLLVLIQMKNWSARDSEFAMSATTNLCPSFVFGEKLKKSQVLASSLPIEIPARGFNEEYVVDPLIKKLVEDPPIEKLYQKSAEQRRRP